MIASELINVDEPPKSTDESYCSFESVVSVVFLKGEQDLLQVSRVPPHKILEVSFQLAAGRVVSVTVVPLAVPVSRSFYAEFEIKGQLR